MTIRQLNFANLADKDSTEQQEVRPRRGRKSLTVIGPANFAESCLYCLIYPTVISTIRYGPCLSRGTDCAALLLETNQPAAIQPFYKAFDDSFPATALIVLDMNVSFNLVDPSLVS